MRVVEGFERVPTEVRGGVLAIGNFDGVHRGHQALMHDAILLARGLSAPAGVLVFEPHPRAFFRPDAPFFRLTSLSRKIELLGAFGLDFTAVLRFDGAFAALSADAFVTDVLVRGFAVRHVVVGYDFQFGHGRTGTAEVLLRRGSELGFGVTVVTAVTDGKSAYSSSRIRAALRRGDVAAAALELGHRWRVIGDVVGGAKRGTGLGFPTANIHLPAGTELGHGIYAVYVHVDGERHAGAAYFGNRPTFDGGAPVLEIFLLDFDGNLYGKAIAVEFVDFVRGDQKFDSGDSLAAQMTRDVATTRAMLAGIGRTDPLAGLPLAGR